MSDVAHIEQAEEETPITNFAGIDRAFRLIRKTQMEQAEQMATIARVVQSQNKTSMAVHNEVAAMRVIQGNTHAAVMQRPLAAAPKWARMASAAQVMLAIVAWAAFVAWACQ